MSSALVRKALEFVDQEENSGKRSKRRVRASRREGEGQGSTLQHREPYKRKSKPAVKEDLKSAERITEDNIRKLLALSRPTTDTAIAGKIVERAVKGKPLLEKIEVKVEEGKSILFPEEEPFKTFEKQYFCS